MTRDLSLHGRVAVVTGASKGIGRALAVGLAAQGALVVVNYKGDASGAEATCATIERAGGRAFAIQADVGEPEEVRRMISSAHGEFGRLDVLVNNAGRTRFASAEEATADDWEDVIRTNLRGPFVATVEAAKRMRHGGSIINISSCAASLAIPLHAIYTTSKTGLEGMTRQLAFEYARIQVRVNAVAPGPTSMARNDEYSPTFDADWSQRIPMGRVPRPEDYVGSVVFLASDGSRFVTGQVLHVDGGWSITGDSPGMREYDFTTDRLRD